MGQRTVDDMTCVVLRWIMVMSVTPALTMSFAMSTALLADPMMIARFPASLFAFFHCTVCRTDPLKLSLLLYSGY